MRPSFLISISTIIQCCFVCLCCVYNAKLRYFILLVGHTVRFGRF
nr:MAG TPA: hypothetical protein [Bacteriophage sp.]DAO57399.1 MAG TPA: hypothetical protein [Caudoviricetes sp.]